MKLILCCFLLAIISTALGRPSSIKWANQRQKAKSEGIFDNLIGDFTKIQRCVVEKIHGPQNRAMPKANAQNGFLDRFEDILENMLICLRSIREGSNDSPLLEIESKQDKVVNTGNKQTAGFTFQIG